MGRDFTSVLLSLPKGDTTAKTPPSEFPIFLYGETDTKKGKYTFDAESAEAVLSSFSDYGNRLTLDYEHQALSDPPVKAPAAGNYRLELRDDGLYAADVHWTDEAAKHLSAGEYLYYSPAFHSDEQGRPNDLLNIALTNLPATKRMKPLVAYKADNKDETMKTVLSTLALKADASEAEALSAINALKFQLDELVKLTGKGNANEASAVITAWKHSHEEAAQLKAQLDKIRKDAEELSFNSQIKDAERAGKISPAESDPKRVYAMSLKGKEDSLNLLSLYLNTLSSMVSGTSAPVKEPEAVNQVVSLTAKEKKLAHQMGVKEAELLARKKARIEQLRDRNVDISNDDDEDAA